jgi:hypothetical protein
MNLFDVLNITVSIMAIPLICLSGPTGFINKFMKNEEIIKELAGFRISMTDIQPDIPFTVVFIENSIRSFIWDKNNSKLVIQGDLETLTARDLRFLIIYLAKILAPIYDIQPIHASSLIDSKSKGILLYGSADSGKSTLCLSLINYGFKLVAADIAVINSNMEILAGSKHLDVYPAFINDYFKDLQFLLNEENNYSNGFASKIKIPENFLMQNEAVIADCLPYTICAVFKISLKYKEYLPFCIRMDNRQKLNTSLMLHEDWNTRLALCPSWELLFPEIYYPDSQMKKAEMAITLAGIDHFEIVGDLNFCTDAIINSNTSF